MDFTVAPLQQPRWYQNRKLWIAIGIGLVVIVALVMLLSGSSFSQAQVSLELTGPAEASGGDLITYTVAISNHNKVSLENAQLVVYYPPDAIRASASTQTVTADTINLGTLAPASTQEKKIPLYLVGVQGSVKTVRAVLTFTPQGIASRLQTSAQAATTITHVSVPLTVVAPPTVINGEAITYIIDYRNQTAGDMSDLKLRVKYPDGFTITSQTPRPTSSSVFERTDAWVLPRLAPGGSGRISVVGKLSGREGEGKQLHVVLQRAGIDFEAYDASSVISSPLLSLSMSVNNLQDYVAHLGDTLSYVMLIENNSDIDLSSLLLNAHIDGAMVDVTSIQSSGYYDTKTKTVNWNSSVVPELALLRAHQSVRVPLELKLLSAFPRSSVGARDSLVSVSATVETDQVPSQLAGATLSAQDSAITKISSAPTFNEQIMLSSADAPAQGPYPPRVGQKTSYVVRWSVINPANELKNAKISATFLPGVEMVGILRVTGTQAAPVYDARTQTMTWALGSVPGGVGISFPAAELWYQISQTPSVNQVGSTVSLLKNITFEATDALTGEKFMTTARDVSTGDVVDSNEHGIVQQ